jgi:hypothetical protein
MARSVPFDAPFAEFDEFDDRCRGRGGEPVPMAFPDRGRKPRFLKIPANFNVLAFRCPLTIDQRALPPDGLAKPLGCPLMRFGGFPVSDTGRGKHEQAGF